MIFKKMNIDQLKYADYNPRKALKEGDPEYEKIKRSIQEFGYVDPIIVNTDDTIIGGHQRATVLKALGYETVDVVVVEIDKTKEKALNIALNKISGEWQMDKLKDLLQELEGQIEIGITGFDDEEIKELLARMDTSEATDDDFDVDEALENITEPKAKRGDIYILGNHRLMCGDSTESKEVAMLMNEQLADVIVTDPPYNVNYGDKAKMMDVYQKGHRNTNHILNDNMDDKAFYNFLFDMYAVAFQNTKPGGTIYVFHSETERINFTNAFITAGFKLSEVLVWVKNSLVLSRQDYHWKHEPIIYGWKEGAGHYFIDDRTQSTVIDQSMNIEKMKKEELVEMLKVIFESAQTTVIYENKPTKNDIHPTMKPVALVGRLIKNSSRPSELVYEPFGGSGSTLIASEQLGRRCNCMELDPKYVDVIIERWEKHTGDKAVKINEGN